MVLFVFRGFLEERRLFAEDVFDGDFGEPDAVALGVVGVGVVGGFLGEHSYAAVGEDGHG